MGVEHARRHREGGGGWFTTNFAAKMARAASDTERWRISGERKRFLTCRLKRDNITPPHTHSPLRAKQCASPPEL